MKRYIRSADLKYYNANSRGTNTGDCVKRSISLAFDVSYNEVSKLLNNKMKELHISHWNISPVFSPVIKELGGGKSKIEKAGITVNEFADTHDPNNIYIVLCGEKDNGKSTHMVCIRDGKIWDSWDCRNYYVTKSWTIDASDRTPIQELKEDYLERLTRDYAVPTVKAELTRYSTRKNMQVSSISIVPFIIDYTVELECAVKLDPDELIIKKRYYSFTIVLTIEPSWSEEQIIKFMQTKGKQKAYDKMWSVNEQEKKLREAEEVKRGLKDDKLAHLGYLTTREQKFYNNLPGWAKPLVLSLSIRRSGSYSDMDNYQLKLRKLPSDTSPKHPSTFWLNSEYASEMHNMLKEYRENNRIEGIDYSYFDEY